MEEEALDWGHDDDELQVSYPSYLAQDNNVAHDAEDAVSLGGDEDDLNDLSAYEFKPQQEVEHAPLSRSSRSSRPPSTPHQHETPPPKHAEYNNTPHRSSYKSESPSVIRSQPLSMAKLTHALPPKPILASTVVSHSPPLATTLASSMVYGERRSNGRSRAKSDSVEASDRLPPDWEIRHARSGGREAYYYNVRTHESTWTRPQGSGRVASPTKDTRDSRARSPSRGVDDGVRTQGSARNSLRKESKRRDSPTPAVGTDLTYEDRHYRPSDTSPSAHVDRASRGQARLSSLTRSATPPPRRDVHSQRDDFSRSISPAIDAWRQNNREEDRSWGRSRNQDSRSLSPDTRPRGRRQRTDLEPPLAQDEPIRRDHSREWPAHSTLSASSPPTPTSRTWRLSSSRGGGRFYASFEKPRGLSYVASSLRIPTTTLVTRLEDARHHGSFFIFSFLMSLYQPSLSILTRSSFCVFHRTFANS